LAAAKKEAEDKKMMELAKEMEVQAKQQAIKQQAKAVAGGAVVESQLWTERYAPTTMKDIIGNKGLVEKLQRWLRDWFVGAGSVTKCSGRRISNRILRSLGQMGWDCTVLLFFLDRRELGRQLQLISFLSWRVMIFLSTMQVIRGMRSC
jgi:hypothetical protein